MNKKMLLLILCVGTAIVSKVVVLYELSPYKDAIETSINEINSNPSAWVNKTVAVEGKLSGPFLFAGRMPPWNYKLYGPNGSSIGVFWNSWDDYDSDNIRVVGVVRKGYWHGWGGSSVCYYIEAQKIDSLSKALL